MAYKHGIEVAEKATSFPSPLSTKYGVQVVFGTAPVNLADRPYETANRPIKVSSFAEAEKLLGYSDDWKSYTLCQSMHASFKVFQIYPIIFVNVLDPNKHVKELEIAEYVVNNHQVIVKKTGVLSDKVIVMAETNEAVTGTAKAGEALTDDGAQALVGDKDYITSFDNAGNLLITLLSTGSAYQSAKISISGKIIAPEMVAEEDIIGFYDIETGKETGLEVLRQVYPKHGLVPSILLAPGWTEKPNVGAAMQGKCEGISGVFRAMCLLDLDTEKAKKYTDCLKVKTDVGYDEKHSIVLWPMLLKDRRSFYFSAVYGAMMSYHTVVNGDIPYVYPSGKALAMDGAALADGTEILLDQMQAGSLNGDGVVTAFHDGEWKAYGNNTGCYPDNMDPKDRWIGCRRMFDYVENYFVTEYRRRLDAGMDRRTVDDIVNSFNIWGNSLVALGMCAGLHMEYRKEENSIDDILAGHMNVRMHFAPYTPAEYINAMIEFDVSALENAMTAKEG